MYYVSVGEYPAWTPLSLFRRAPGAHHAVGNGGGWTRRKHGDE